MIICISSCINRSYDTHFVYHLYSILDIKSQVCIQIKCLVLRLGNQRREHEAMETPLGYSIVQSIGTSVSTWFGNS